MSVKEDLDIYPCLIYDKENKRLVEHNREWGKPFGYTGHHFIRTQWIRNNREIVFTNNLLRFQKIIFVPTFPFNMHGDIHTNNRNFKERWGIDREELIFDEKNWRKYTELAL